MSLSHVPDIASHYVTSCCSKLFKANLPYSAGAQHAEPLLRPQLLLRLDRCSTAHGITDWHVGPSPSTSASLCHSSCGGRSFTMSFFQNVVAEATGRASDARCCTSQPRKVHCALCREQAM